MIRASIAMAVYNGEKYLSEQMNSILSLIGENDEVIISCDVSTDKTYEIAKRYEGMNDCVHVYMNEQQSGVCGNFNNAISHCSGKYIFISDQDDIWLDDKINKIVDVLEHSSKAMAIHNGYETDSKLNIIKPLFEDIYTNFWGTFVLNCGQTLGCCMAIKKEYLSLVYPFYDDDYDRWMMLACAVNGGIEVLNEKLIYHRVHENNITPKHRRNMIVVILDRIIKLKWLIMRSYMFNCHYKKNNNKDLS